MPPVIDVECVASAVRPAGDVESLIWFVEFQAGDYGDDLAGYEFPDEGDSSVIALTDIRPEVQLGEVDESGYPVAANSRILELEGHDTDVVVSLPWVERQVRVDMFSEEVRGDPIGQENRVRPPCGHERAPSLDQSSLGFSVRQGKDSMRWCRKLTANGQVELPAMNH
jgi:hypothetical protein